MEIAEAAQRRGGRFEVERMARREGVNGVGKRYTYKEPEIVVVGRIPFPPMFLGETPTHGLNGAVQSLREAVAVFDERTDAAALAQAFRAMQRARQHLIDADRAHQGAALNLDTGWMEALCEWANERDGLTAEYWLEGPLLCHTELSGSGCLQVMDRAVLGRSNLDRILEIWS
jgi:hypothetical protein